MPINITGMDPKNLYRKDQYTDGKAGTISENVPVYISDEGEVLMDPVRQVTYEGQTFLNGQPLGFVIPAKTLAEAVALFAQAVGGTIQELQSKTIQQQIINPTRGLNGQPLIIDQSRKRR